MSTTLYRIKTPLRLTFALVALLIFTTIEKSDARAFSCCAHSFETYGFLEEIDNHILSLRAKNIPQAYFKHTSREFRKKTTYPEFQRIINKYPSLYDNFAITLHSIKFQEDIGRYSGTLTSKMGEVLLIEYDLLKEGEAWKILGFTLLKIPNNEDRPLENLNNEIKLAQASHNSSKGKESSKCDKQQILFDQKKPTG